MKDKPKCPFWDEKKGECKVLDILLDLTEVSKQIAETIEVHTPPKTSLGPVPGSHGQIESHSSTPLDPINMVEDAMAQRPSGGIVESLSKIPSPFFQPPPDEKRPYWGSEEDQKKKQEYWDKELKKMDEEKKE